MIPNLHNIYGFALGKNLLAVLGICDSFVQIRVRGSVPLTNGSRSVPLTNGWGSGSRRPKSCGSPILFLIILVMLSCFKAVRCDAVPSLTIPTDEHLKLFGKKQPRPPKALVVARTEASRRFKEHTS
jgi:hypothetical protein